MKNTNILDVGKGLAIGLIIAIIFLWLRGCQSETPSVAKTIQTKEVKGKFEAVKPVQEKIVYKVVNGTKIVYKESNNDKFLQSQIDELVFENERLIHEFITAPDSLKKSMYDKAIEIKSFNQDFEDDKLKITTSGLVRGEIQSIKSDYTIKPQTIELPQEKQVVFRLLGGFEYGNNTTLSNQVLKANLSGQLRNGNIIRTSVDNLKNYFIGYDFSIFSIKGKKK